MGRRVGFCVGTGDGLLVLVGFGVFVGLLVGAAIFDSLSITEYVEQKV